MSRRSAKICMYYGVVEAAFFIISLVQVAVWAWKHDEPLTIGNLVLSFVFCWILYMNGHNTASAEHLESNQVNYNVTNPQS